MSKRQGITKGCLYQPTRKITIAWFQGTEGGRCTKGDNTEGGVSLNVLSRDLRKSACSMKNYECMCWCWKTVIVPCSQVLSMGRMDINSREDRGVIVR